MPIAVSLETGTHELLAEVRDRVAVITLNRPQARNSLSDNLTPALRTLIQRLGEDDTVDAVLITGTGTAFCSGGDVKGMGSGRPGPAKSVTERVADLKDKQRRLTGALMSIGKPTIAALPGVAAGAGLSIALACDLRIAARSAFISTGYARVGLSGDYGISWLLTQLVGTARARELMFTSDKVDAARCMELGLFNRLADDERLAQQAFEWAALLAAGPPVALRLIKENLNDALHMGFLESLDKEAERISLASASEDHKEAVRAFIEKRPPRFDGR